MDTFYNWYQLRGLAALIVLGVFLLYALLAGWWQYRQAKRGANPMTEQDQPLSVDPSTDSSLATDLQRTRIDVTSIAGPARLAA